MQREDTEVEPRQTLIRQHLDEARPAGLTRNRRRDRHNLPHHNNRQQGQQRREQEDAGHADRAVEQRRTNHRQGKHQADRCADHGHDLGQMLFAREVGRQCRHRRRDGARPLNDPPDDDAGQIVGTGRDDAANHEQQQTEDDHRLAPEAIGGGAVGNLQ